MSGYFAGSMNHNFCRSIISKFCTCVAVVAVSLFGLSGGTIDSPAEAKAKYFSGKSNNSRIHQRSSRKFTHRQHNSISHHRNSGVKYYRSNRVKHRGYANKRHGKFSHHPLRYRGSSITHVQNILINKRAARSKAGYHQYNQHRYHRGRYNRINRVVINGSILGAQTKLDKVIVREDATGTFAIYYDGEKCDQGYDCALRLGTKRSSAKIIVVGPKRLIRSDKDDAVPKVFYPPN